jgi:TIR domain
VPGLSSRGIFLSYRREDAALCARLLRVELRQRIPDAPVFMDLDSIELGLDFAEVIRVAVDSCIVLVALIGRQWATLADEEGRRRLDNPDDWVRFEIGAALERGVWVIPVLVDGARPLRSQQLPVELEQLARIQALELSNDRYEYDADRLFKRLNWILAEAVGAGTGRQSMPGANDEAFTDPPGVSADGKTLPTDAEPAAQPIRIRGSTYHAVLGGAVRSAQPVTYHRRNASLSASLAAALAVTDPDLAESFAQSITDDSLKASALASIAKAQAAAGLNP